MVNPINASPNCGNNDLMVMMMKLLMMIILMVMFMVMMMMVSYLVNCLAILFIPDSRLWLRYRNLDVSLSPSL